MSDTDVETIRRALRGSAEREPSPGAALDALDALAAERDRLALENERLRRIEEAAEELLEQSSGRRSATQILTAMANLRAALKRGSGRD